MPHITTEISACLAVGMIAGWVVGGYFGWRQARRTDLVALLFARPATPGALILAAPVALFTLATLLNLAAPVAIVSITFALTSFLPVLGWALFFMIPYSAGHGVSRWYFSQVAPR